MRTVALFGQLQRYAQSNRKILLPLQESDVPNVELLRQALHAYQEYGKLLKNARLSFEASAMVTHRLGVMDVLGTAALQILEKRFSNFPIYHILPSTLDVLLTRILCKGEKVSIRQIRQLLLFALSFDTPDIALLNYIKRIEHIADEFDRGNRLTVSLQKIIDEGNEVARSLFDNQLRDNLDFLLQELPKDMDSFDLPIEVQRIFFSAFFSFFTASRDTQDLFKKDSGPFIEGWGLLNPPESLVEPHVYDFVQPVNEHLAVMSDDANLNQNDLFTMKEFYMPDRTIRILRLMPSPRPVGKRFLDKTSWIEIAKGPAGAVALLEPPNFIHPLKGWWLRTTMSELGVKFVRPRKGSLGV